MLTHHVGWGIQHTSWLPCYACTICDYFCSAGVEVRVQWELSADGVEVVDPCELPYKCDDVATKLIVQVSCGYSTTKD